MTENEPYREAGRELHHSSDSIVARIRMIQKVSRVFFIIAIALLGYSYFSPEARTPLFLYARTAAWGVCGLLSVVEGLLFGKAGQAAGAAYFNALLYFGVAVVTFTRNR